jgi:hypothetical protein
MEHKTFEIVRVPQSTMYRVGLSGGGETPDLLKGAFTSPSRCKEAIDLYQDKLAREHRAAIAKRASRKKTA